jgi:hypothetical protein
MDVRKTWYINRSNMKSKPAGIILFPIIVAALLFACEERADKIDYELTANVVGYDLNCSTCILSFPEDYVEVQKELGVSPGNLYNAINLDKGDFQVGQKLRVKVRKPEPDELNACIAMYPSENYENLFVISYNYFDNLVFNDTVELPVGDCLYDPRDKFYICLEAVLNDSRCPEGAYCFWEGNAEARFRFEKMNETPVLFNLNTHRGFTTDTIIGSYKIALIGLSPNPSIEHPGRKLNYKARITVSRQE